MTATEIPALAAALAAALRPATLIPPERRLWSAAEVADYSGYTYSSVMTTIVCLPDFPVAIRIGQTGNPRWVSGEVMAWFEARRQKRRAA